MLLDLWTFSSILNDILDLATYFIDNGSYSIGLLFGSSIFLFVSYIAWRSTNIPHDVPSAPSPPFVITIQNSPNNNAGGRRQNLSDIRIISTGSYVDFIGSRHPFGRIGRGGTRSRSSANNTTRDPLDRTATAAQQTSDRIPSTGITAGGQQQQQPSASRSVFLGFLRHPVAATRGWVPFRSRFNLIPPGFFVIGRVFHHQHRRHNSPPRHINTNTAPTFDSSSTTSNLRSSSSSLEDNRADISQNSDLPRSESLHPEINSFSETNTTTNINNQSGAFVSETANLNSENNGSTVAQQNYSESESVDADSSDKMTSQSDHEKTTLDASESSSTGTGPPAQGSSPSLTTDSPPDVRFTLKFLNDTQMEVTTHLGEKIFDFKRRHFATELSAHKIVRLIFNGRVLDQDNKTLQESGIFDQCVVHCLIVTPQPTNQQNSGTSGARNSNIRGGPRGPEPGMFFVSFIAILLFFLWFVCINFGNHLFTQSAVVSLSVLTGIFIIGVVAFYMPIHTPNNAN